MSDTPSEREEFQARQASNLRGILKDLTLESCLRQLRLDTSTPDLSPDHSEFLHNCLRRMMISYQTFHRSWIETMTEIQGGPANGGPRQN